MIGGKKKALESFGKTRTFDFERFGLFVGGTGVLVAKNSENCDCKNGGIECGVGLRKFTLRSGASIEQMQGIGVRRYLVASYPDESGELVEKFFSVRSNGGLYVYDEEKKVFVWLAYVGADARLRVVSAADGRTRLLAAATGKMYACALPSLETVLLREDTTNAFCVCRNRVFVADTAGKLCYSDPLVPWEFTEDIDGSGKLRLLTTMGKIVALEAFDTVVCVFFERGVMRIEIDGDARDFKVFTLPYAGGLIFGESVGVTGKYILFLATDGLWRTDGKSAERVCKNLPIKPKEVGQVCGEAVFEGKYAVWYLDLNGEKKQVVCRADGADGYFSFPLDGMYDSGGVGLCRYQDAMYCVAEKGETADGASYHFETAALDFGVRGRKTLRSLRLEGEGNCYVQVKADGRMDARALAFENGVAEAAFGDLRGERFAFMFELENGAAIGKLRVRLACVE